MFTMLLLITGYLAISGLCGYFCRRLAERQGRNPRAWMIWGTCFGLFFGPFSLLLLLVPGSLLKRLAVTCAALLTLGAGLFLNYFPAVGAYVCPQCYGFVRLNDTAFVDPSMSPGEKTETLGKIARATRMVEEFYGSFKRQPALLLCATQACNQKLGGTGAAANTYGKSFIHVAPRGLNPVVLAHEFSHVEVHSRIGMWRFAAGALPAWFDEGLAVIVSNDPRYLKGEGDGAQRCLEETSGELPSDRFEWAHFAGKTPSLYAEAACKVLRWMDANGGKAGLFTALSQVADGTRQLP